MRSAIRLSAIALATFATTGHAGNFVDLRSDLVNLSIANGGLIEGANNANVDPLYIETTSATYVPGYDVLPGSLGDSGDVVASTIDYRTFSGATTTGTGTLTLLDWRVTDDVPLLTGQPQGRIYDMVYSDSADGNLVFATRYLNQVDNDQEVNFLYRYGFQGYEVAAAWTFTTDFDLRMFQTGRTESTEETVLNTDTVEFDDDAVRQQADLSLTEGNPWSGLYMVKLKSNAFYSLGGEAIGFFQAGEEGQVQVGGSIAGFVPTPVPEPGAIALLAAGVGFLGLSLGRRRA